MSNSLLTSFSWSYTIILITLWVCFFIYSYRNNVKFPWGFSVVIIGIFVSGIGYHFHNNQVTVFSLSLPFFVCLIGMLWNINNIRSQFCIRNIWEFLRFIGIGLISGLLFGFFVMMTQGMSYIQADAQYTSFALITNSIQTSMAEEFLFRGYFLSYLRKYEFNQISAIVFQSLMFTVLHIPRYSGDWTAIFIIFLSGVVAGYLTWKSNNLVPAFVLHIVVNLIAVIWWLVAV